MAKVKISREIRKLVEKYSRKVYPKIALTASKVIDKSPINPLDAMITAWLAGGIYLPNIGDIVSRYLPQIPQVGDIIHKAGDYSSDGLLYSLLLLSPLLLSTLLTKLRQPLYQKLDTQPRKLSMEERKRNIDYVVGKIKQYKDSPKQPLEDIIGSINESVNNVIYKIDGVKWGDYIKKPRKSIYRGLAKLMGIGGLFYPFTHEVYLTSFDNTDFPASHVAAHEITHWKGYLRENEAEFIAYLAGVNSPYDDIKGSAYEFRLSREFQALSDFQMTPYEKIRYVIELGKRGIPHKLRNKIIKRSIKKIREQRGNPIKKFLKKGLRGVSRFILGGKEAYYEAFTEDLPAFEEKYGREGRNYF